VCVCRMMAGAGTTTAMTMTMAGTTRITTSLAAGVRFTSSQVCPSHCLVVFYHQFLPLPMGHSDSISY